MWGREFEAPSHKYTIFGFVGCEEPGIVQGGRHPENETVSDESVRWTLDDM